MERPVSCSWGSPSAGHSSGAKSIPRECSRPCSGDSDPSSVTIFWPGHWEAALCHQPPLGTASAAKGGLAAALPRAGLSTTTPRLLPSFHFPGCDPGSWLSRSPLPRDRVVPAAQRVNLCPGSGLLEPTLQKLVCLCILGERVPRFHRFAKGLRI